MDSGVWKLIDKIFSKIIKILEEKGIKGITPIIFMFISALVFISPSYIFIVLYKINLFKQFNLIINIISVLIFDVLLFLFLFALELCGQYIDDKNKSLDSGILLKSIVKTIALMGVVSIFLVIFHSICRIKGIDVSIKIGIKTLYITIYSIIVFYFLSIGTKLLEAIRKVIKVTNKLNKIIGIALYIIIVIGMPIIISIGMYMIICIII